MVDYDPNLIGRVFEVTDPVPVTDEMVTEFRKAIGETAETKVSVAPPSFAVTFRNGRQFFEHIPRFGRQGFDAGKDVEFVAPIRAGDTITLSSHVKEIYEKTGRTGSMVFVIVRSTLKNQDGEVVAHVDHRFMNRP